MSQLATESEPPPEVDAPPGFWQRWYWPVITIAALVAFELTASPTLSALLLCCHFGSEDWLTGVWLWRNDPHLGRGRACAWFSFARAVTRTLLCEVPTPRPCYMHSFAMSSSYIVLSESPVHIDLLRMFTAPFTGAASFPLPANTRRSDPSFASCRRHHGRVFRL